MPRDPARSAPSAAATRLPLACFVRAEAALGAAAAARGPLWGAACAFLRVGMKRGWAGLFGGALRPPGWSPTATLAAAGVLDAAVAAIRLIPAPGLDAFRATLAGQFLLGRIFSPWKLVTYALGILAAAAATHGFARGLDPSAPVG